MNIIIKHITLTMIALILALVFFMTLPSRGLQPTISPVAQESPSFEHWDQQPFVKSDRACYNHEEIVSVDK